MENKKIRILVVFGAIANGGVEQIISNIYRCASPDKYEIEAVYHEGGLKFEEVSSLNKTWQSMTEIPQFLTVNWHSYRKWWKDFLKNKDKYDIVHINYIDSAFCYIDLFNKAGTITVGHSHNPKSRPISLGRLISDIISFPSRYLFKYFIACSKQTATECFGKKIADSNRCFVLLNGIDLEKYDYNKEKRVQMRSTLHIEDKIAIGHIGRFASQKNQSFALDVFNEFAKIHPNSELFFIGEGEDKGRIERKTQKLGLSNKVVFTGKTDYVADYLQAFDFFIFPSTYEGLGIALIEAEVSGLKCIISNRVPEEADLKSGLIIRKQLSDKPVIWAKAINDALNHERESNLIAAKQAGFSLDDTTNSLFTFFDSTLHTKRLSIIVPVYNTSKEKLSRLFESFENQETHTSNQIIVVNDGSTNEETLLFLNNYKSEHFEYILVNKMNGGVSSARNLGMKYVTGNYLTFVDSDDYISPKYTSLIINQFKHYPNTQVLIFNWQDIIEKKKKTNIMPLISKRLNKEAAIKYLCEDHCFKGYPWNKAINLDAFGLEDVPLFRNLRLHEDRLWSLELFAKAKKFRVKNKAIYSYFYYNDSAINNTDNYYKIKAEILDYISIFVEISKQEVSNENYKLALIQFFNQTYRDYFIFKKNNKEEIKVAQKHLDNIIENLQSNYSLSPLIRHKITKYYKEKDKQ